MIRWLVLHLFLKPAIRRSYALHGPDTPHWADMPAWEWGYFAEDAAARRFSYHPEWPKPDAG